MAVNESDREDLMREAVALSRRVELEIDGFAEPVVIGFRDSTGGSSFYFGQDPFFGFDALGRLRRSHSEGALFRTQGTTLARMERRRTGTATELVRKDLSDAETESFLANMHDRLIGVLDSLRENRFRILRIVAAEESWRTKDWLLEIESTIGHILSQETPLAPPMPGKR